MNEEAAPLLRPSHLVVPRQSRCVMATADRHLVYVLGHPEAWRLLALVEKGPRDRYEHLRKALGMHPQAFQRLLYWMRGFGLVRVRADHPGRPHRGAIPVHLEIAPKGRAMLDLLRGLERDAQAHREALGLRHAELLAAN